MTRSLASRVIPVVAIMVALLAQRAASQAPPQASTPPAQAGILERTVPVSIDTAWERMIVALQTLKPPGDLLQSGNLFEHPHGNTQLNKAKGTMTTPTFRYFKIFSAGFPPMEKDYRDSYLIILTLSSLVEVNSPPSTVVRIKRKFEYYDTAKNSWIDGDPSKENVGVPVEVLLTALEDQLAQIPPPLQTEGTPGTLQSELRPPSPGTR